MHICYAKEATKDAMGTGVPLLLHSLNRVATLVYGGGINAEIGGYSLIIQPQSKPLPHNPLSYMYQIS